MSEIPPESKKLSILALHGHRQNAETFREKTGSFRKILRKYATFTYITAPHKVIDETSTEQNAGVGLLRTKFLV